MTESIVEHNDAAQEPFHIFFGSQRTVRRGPQKTVGSGPRKIVYEMHESSKLHVILTTIQILIGMGTIGE